MTTIQWIKLLLKIVTVLPVVVEGIKAVITKYKETNEDDLLI